MKQQFLAIITNPVLNDDLGRGDGGTALGLIMARLYTTVVFIGGLALLLYIVWGGLNWVMAGGDKGKIEEAKNRITNAIIGMALLVGTVAIVRFLGPALGVDFLNPTLEIGTTSPTP